MELIKRKVNLGLLRSYGTPLIYEFLSKELKNKGCLNVNSKQIILQNAEDFDQNWGKIDVEYIYLNIFLTQNIDDMGIFTDVSFVDEPVDYFYLFDKFSTFTEPLPSFQLFSGSTLDPYIRYFVRLSGETTSDFFASSGIITGLTDDKLYTVTTYFSGTPYVIGMNLSDDPNYFIGVTDLYSNLIQYTIDANVNNVMGSGLHYNTYDFNRLVYNSTINSYFSIPYTEVYYQSEGWNINNISLSAITKEEIYFGIVFPPKVENNVFIERGSVSIFEKHSRLGSILNITELELYGNGYYNLIN